MENKAVWQEVEEDVTVTITIKRGKHVLRNEIKVPIKNLEPRLGQKPHMHLAKYMEDYFYPMAQNFCDKVISFPDKE